MKTRERFVAVGQMTGTSRDGVDTAIVEIEGRFPDNSIRLLHAETFRYNRWMRSWLSLDTKLDPRTLSAPRLAAMHFKLGGLFGHQAATAIKNAGLRPRDIDVIGCHGQTIYHRPASHFRIGEVTASYEYPSTLQVGSGAKIAAETGVTTVTDFRSADVAVGGEGAPLVPIYDYVVLRSPRRSRVALNIGGIANLTAIPRKSALESILSFDSGPGNCVIDTAMRLLTGGRLALDRGGTWARKGEPHQATLRAMLRHGYFSQPPPKSTGWEEFGVAYTARKVEKMRAAGLDKYCIVRTVSEAVAESIARAAEHFVRPRMATDEVIVTGGGSNNLFLMEMLRRRLAPALVDRGEAFGVDSRYKEACAFAYLAYLCLEGLPANVVSQREGLDPVILGAVYPGRPSRRLVRPRPRRLRC